MSDSSVSKRNPRLYNGVQYWGSARGPGVTLFYEKCGRCGAADEEGVGRHRGKGLCQGCYTKALKKGDMPYAPLNHYVAEREYVKTQADIAEKRRVKKERNAMILRLLQEGNKAEDIAKSMNMTTRNVFYLQKKFKQEGKL